MAETTKSAPSPETSAASPPPASTGTSSARGVFLLCAGLGLGIAGAAAFVFYGGQMGLAPAELLSPATPSVASSPAEENAPPMGRVEAMRQDLARQAGRQRSNEERLGFMEAQLGALPPAQAVAVKSDITALINQAAALKAALAEEREARQRALAELEVKLARPGGGDYALLGLVLTGLHHAAASGGFDLQLRQIELVLGENPDFAGDITALKAFAAKGAPSAAELEGRFAKASAAAFIALPEGALMARAGQWLVRVVRLRPVSGQAAETPSALLARMDALVEAHEFAPALALAQELPPKASAAMEDWLTATQIRIAIDGHISALETKTAQLLAEAVEEDITTRMMRQAGGTLSPPTQKTGQTNAQTNKGQ